MRQTQVLVLDKNQIRQKINRIAYQIYEDNLGEKEIVLAGIWDRGYKVALRLQQKLNEIAPFKVQLLRIDIEKQDSKLIATTAKPENEWKNKVIILVDDVLNSGKTLLYGLGLFLNTPHKKIRVAVLVDRSHKTFPIATDFVGLKLATVLKEHVDVIMDVEGEQDRVYLS